MLINVMRKTIRRKTNINGMLCVLRATNHNFGDFDDFGCVITTS